MLINISTNAFTYYSNGDIEQHPIFNAFDGVSNSYWVSSINETEANKSCIFVNFSSPAYLDAIIFSTAFLRNTSSNSITYSGYPRVISVYSSSDGETFKLEAVFRGYPAKTDAWKRIQLVFSKITIFEKMKLEFSDVTVEIIFHNEKMRLLTCGDIFFLTSPRTCLIPSSKPTDDWDYVCMEKLNGKYADSSYIRSNIILSDSFTYYSNGDLIDHPLSYAFKNMDYYTYWVSSIVETETTKSCVFINFISHVCLEAILFNTAYVTKTPNRTFLGFPRTVKIYTSLNNEQFRLNTVFSGEPEPLATWSSVQYVFLRPIWCNKLKLEFANVTFDGVFSNNYSVVLNEIRFISYSGDTFPTPSPHPTPTESIQFSQSYHFSESNRFSKSNIFPESKYFSCSIMFSVSNAFSRSFQFSQSNVFSRSFHFNKSEYFTCSIQFSKSKKFSRSKYFSRSSCFSKSREFSTSDYFSESREFSTLNKFSDSKEFSASDYFSESVEFSFSDTFMESKEFSISNKFSDSKEFSDSEEFTKSNEFSILRTLTKPFTFTLSSKFTCLITPSQTLKKNQIISISISMSLEWTRVKSVSMSITEIKSNIISYTFFMNTMIETNYETKLFEYIPYIIAYLSPSYVEIKISIDMNKNKKRITQEQLIGVVCGSVAGFFVILSIIILILQKKNSPIYSACDVECYEYSDDEEIIMITNTKTIKYEDEISEVENQEFWI